MNPLRNLLVTAILVGVVLAVNLVAFVSNSLVPAITSDKTVWKVTRFCAASICYAIILDIALILLGKVYGVS